MSIGALWHDNTKTSNNDSDARARETVVVLDIVIKGKCTRTPNLNIQGGYSESDAKELTDALLQWECQYIDLENNHDSPYSMSRYWTQNKWIQFMRKANSRYLVEPLKLFIRMAHTNPCCIFRKATYVESSSEIDGELTIKRDYKNPDEYLWLAATEYFGDLWFQDVLTAEEDQGKGTALTPKNQQSKSVKFQDESTAEEDQGKGNQQSKSLTPLPLAEKEGVEKTASPTTSEKVPQTMPAAVRGIVRCDSNDTFFDRGIPHSNEKDYPPMEASTHNNTYLSVAKQDEGFAFPRRTNWKRMHPVFPPTDHHLKETHGILTICVHGRDTEDRDKQMWSVAGLKEEEYTNHFKISIARRAIIEGNNEIFKKGWKECITTNQEHSQACDKNPILKNLRDLSVMEYGTVSKKLWEDECLPKETIDKKTGKETMKKSSSRYRDSAFRKYHFGRKDHEPGMDEVGACIHGRLSGKLPDTGSCLCVCCVAKMSKGGFPDNNILRWQTADKATLKLLPFREMLHSSATHRDKELYVLFQSVFVETHEQSCNRDKYVIIGEDAQPSAHKDSLGICPSIPPLCLEGIACLVGDFDKWKDD
jgi:hypothetical protein